MTRRKLLGGAAAACAVAAAGPLVAMLPAEAEAATPRRYRYWEIAELPTGPCVAFVRYGDGGIQKATFASVHNAADWFHKERDLGIFAEFTRIEWEGGYMESGLP